jgi:hypothetical protein
MPAENIGTIRALSQILIEVCTNTRLLSRLAMLVEDMLHPVGYLAAEFLPKGDRSLGRDRMPR